VDNGIPIDLCLKRFSHWVDRISREHGVVCEGSKGDISANTACVTWSGNVHNWLYMYSRVNKYDVIIVFVP